MASVESNNEKDLDLSGNSGVGGASAALDMGDHHEHDLEGQVAQMVIDHC